MNLSEVAKWSVLVVDDERDNLEVVAETLGFFGAAVKTAKDGHDALELMKSFTPTLILLDLSMPVMDGWTLLGRLKEKEETKQIPVIALTAHAMQTDKDRVYEAGFDGYLTKPVNVPTLLKDVLAALEEGKTMKAPADTVQETAVETAAKAEPVAAQVEVPAPKAAASSEVPAAAPANSNGAENTNTTPAAASKEQPTTEAASTSQPESVAASQNTVQSTVEEPKAPADEPASGDAVRIPK